VARAAKGRRRADYETRRPGASLRIDRWSSAQIDRDFSNRSAGRTHGIAPSYTRKGKSPAMFSAGPAPELTISAPGREAECWSRGGIGTGIPVSRGKRTGLRRHLAHASGSGTTDQDDGIRISTPPDPACIGVPIIIREGRRGFAASRDPSWGKAFLLRLSVLVVDFCSSKLTQRLEDAETLYRLFTPA
jgi:hypothetical protein